MLKHVYNLHKRKGLDAIWKWAMDGKGPLGKSKRFRVLAEFAARKRKKAKAKNRPAWAKRWEKYRAESEKYWRRHKRRQDVKWPDSFPISELLYHAPPHFHLASPHRDKLIQIAKIGVEKYHCRIGEFPPFDPVEAVHVNGSWHYRDSSSPSTPRDFSNRGDGLAFDANDLDGGNDEEFAFFKEVEERYR